TLLICTTTTDSYTLSLHDALPIYSIRMSSISAFPGPFSVALEALENISHFLVAEHMRLANLQGAPVLFAQVFDFHRNIQRLRQRSEEHTSELQSRENLVCRLLLEK